MKRSTTDEPNPYSKPTTITCAGKRVSYWVDDERGKLVTYVAFAPKGTGGVRTDLPYDPDVLQSAFEAMVCGWVLRHARKQAGDGPADRET